MSSLRDLFTYLFINYRDFMPSGILSWSVEKVQNHNFFKKPNPRKPFDNYLTPIEATSRLGEYSG